LGIDGRALTQTTESDHARGAKAFTNRKFTASD
jgi:hypothetical protein